MARRRQATGESEEEKEKRWGFTESHKIHRSFMKNAEKILYFSGGTSSKPFVQLS